MSIKQRAGSDKWYYRFSYGRHEYCEGGFRLASQAYEAERVKRDSLIARQINPTAPVLAAPRQLLFDEACTIYLRIHGPSHKGGVSKDTRSPYAQVQYRLKLHRRAWRGRFLDSITKYDVRDFLKRYNSVGTIMRHLNTLTKLFNSFDEWNRDGNILEFPVTLPPYNPATAWRKSMKSSEKKELPRQRVLSPQEWQKLKAHLPPRALAICNIALRRFLRLGDIKRISSYTVKGLMLEGTQGKTEERFTVPIMSEQPDSYDFTNFRREWEMALIASGLNYPEDHPLHVMPRDLRRTGATWAYGRTKDLRSIQKMLGHRNLSTTERYLHVSDANLQGIAKVVDEMADGTHSWLGTGAEQKASFPKGPFTNHINN